MSDKVYDQVLNEFKHAGASMRCAKVKSLLNSLGFTVKDVKKGNHKVFGHSGIERFLTSDYDCGHGANPEVKKAYIKKIIKTLKLYEDEIRGFLNRESK